MRIRPGQESKGLFPLSARPSTRPAVIFSESVFDEKGALKLANPVLIDRSISIDAFEEDPRLERDLLGDAADACRKERFGKLGRSLL
ncbi:MAG TPA: hypothetical protein VMA37_11945 [Acetobacteraceae bacterium]|nr:hypothetical protein [Acetobacteraceae bacterium]